MKSGQSATITECESQVEDTSLRPGQLSAAYEAGRLLNHLRWQSKVTVIDCSTATAVVESILDDLIPMLMDLVPEAMIDEIESTAVSCRAELSDMLAAYWFSESVTDAHIDFHTLGYDAACFETPLNSALSPWKRLRAALATALQESAVTMVAFQLGEKADQLIHTADVVDALLNRIIDAAPTKKQELTAQESPGHLGGSRRRRVDAGEVQRPSSMAGLPVHRNWSRMMHALCRRIGIAIPVDVNNEADASETLHESIHTAFEELDRQEALPQTARTSKPQKRGRRPDPNVARRNKQICEVWKTGRLKTYNDLGKEFGVSAEVARSAVRQNKRKSATRRQSGLERSQALSINSAEKAENS